MSQRLTVHQNNAMSLEVIASWEKYFLVLEHVSKGDLFEHLEKYGHRTEEEARVMFRQLTSAVTSATGKESYIRT